MTTVINANGTRFTRWENISEQEAEIRVRQSQAQFNTAKIAFELNSDKNTAKRLSDARVNLIEVESQYMDFNREEEDQDPFATYIEIMEGIITEVYS